jgi:hypothetical protein
MNLTHEAKHQASLDELDCDQQLATSLAALLTLTVCHLQAIEKRLDIDLATLKLLANQCVREYARHRGLSDDELDAVTSSVRIQARRREREETRTPQRQAN